MRRTFRFYTRIHPKVLYVNLSTYVQCARTRHYVTVRCDAVEVENRLFLAFICAKFSSLH